MPNVYLPAKPKPITVPEGLTDGALIVQHAVREHGVDALDDGVVAHLVRTAEETITGTAKQIASAVNAIQNDQTQTDVANLKRSKQLADKALTAALAKIDAANDAAKRTLDELTRASQPPRAKDATQEIRHGEIRAALRAMKPEDRMKLLRTTDDDEVVAAAAHGAGLLTGLHADERDLAVDLWRRRRHPEKVERIERIGKALASYRRMAELLIRWGNRLHADKAADIEAAERSHQIAQEAMRAVAAE